MANESWVFGATATNPYSGEVSFASVTTGGTLTGSNVIELRILKSSLGAAANVGFNTKQNVIKQLHGIADAIAKDTWPPAADSLV